MGYEIHITKASDWVDATAHPIDERTWLALAARSSDLTEKGTVSFSDGPSGEVIEYPMYLLRSADGPSLYWRRGEVVVSGALSDDIPGIMRLGAALDALVVGDDGERYT